MSATTHFIEPLDVLFLRGNKLFGDAGSFGESLVPPWPSVVAGAYRSALLAHKGYDLAAFASGSIDDTELGTPRKPGHFAVTAFQLARRHGDGHVEPLYSLLADLVVTEDQDNERGPVVRRLRPTALTSSIVSSYPLLQLPVMAEPKRSKPASGYWLGEQGFRAYLAGQTPTAGELTHSSALWGLDTRVGVGLETERRRAADGRLFTVQAVALAKREHKPGHDRAFDVGFLARISGASVPERLTLRLGGDGRGARSATADPELPEPDYNDLARAGRCRMVLTTPGVFADGWTPTGVIRIGERDYRFELHGVRARIVAAAVPRADVVSGWDLAAWSRGKGGPKPAQRVAPIGSVYWLDELDATPEALRKLAERGLWRDEEYDSSMRRAEGFNRLTFAKH